MDTEFNVLDLYETFTTDFDIAAVQCAVWTFGVTRFTYSVPYCTNT
jgi:hypothetical protein